MSGRNWGKPLADKADIYHQRTAITASSVKVSLGRKCSKIHIWLDPSSSGLHIDLASGTAATTSDPLIPSGGKFDYEGQAIDEFYVIGTGTTGSFNVIAY